MAWYRRSICLMMIFFCGACDGLSAVDKRWHPVTVGPIGGAAAESFKATLAMPDGTVLIGGTLSRSYPVTDLALFVDDAFDGKAAGILMQYCPVLQRVLRVKRFYSGSLI